ncbi:manganese efflux pump MntP family protein [Clostridium oryzae]|uniref:Putative manganese efflux pump MntP n=1 Tax=Clostridium oryzae TaxID=1450648 RepID=A0A1V4IGD5_9CLOT|nr:manganese efflux pump [Clostridium oryzae]OPJ58996.1 putative manganese efflux pump MntP [Clostridium oryzae]
MNIIDLFVIALALSLDAFAVAVSLGLSPNIKTRNEIMFSLSFGFFQFLLSYIGSYLGGYVERNIISVPEVFGGGIIALIGVIMIKEGMDTKKQFILFSFKMYIILGISVSIDALVVGFSSFHHITSTYLTLLYTVFIGLVTLLMCFEAFILSKYLKKISIIAEYAEYIGGIILIVFGIKFMFY